MLTKTLSEAKKKQRNILIKAMNNDIGSIDSAKDSWNPAQISERAKDISYIRSLVDSWNTAQLNEALKMLDLPVIDTWNPAQIEEQRMNLVFYLAERTLTGNPITINILGNLTPEVTSLKVTMNPIQDTSQGNPSPTNICPISGRTEASVTRTGVNVWGGETLADDIVSKVASATKDTTNKTVTYTAGNIRGIDVYTNFIPNTRYTAIITMSAGVPNMQFHYTDGTTTTISAGVTVSAEGKTVDAVRGQWVTGTSVLNYEKSGIFEGVKTADDFEPYTAETKTHQYSETIYGGVDDFMNGGLTNEWGYIASYDGETIPGVWISDRDVYAPGTTPATGAEVCYKLANSTTIETTPEEITLLKGTNVLSTDGDSIELKYKQNF